MCDYGLLVLSRYVEQCEGRHTPISVLSEENRVEVFQILTPARCDDVSRLSQLNICAKHLKLTNEVLKSLKKKVKCQLEVCDKKKDRSVTAQQSWAIFQKTHTHVLPGSPICWAHRREVNRWIADFGDEGGVHGGGGLEEKKLPLQGDEEEKGDALVAGVEEEQADAIVDQQGGRVEVAAVSKKRKALLRWKIEKNMWN